MVRRQRTEEDHLCKKQNGEYCYLKVYEEIAFVFSSSSHNMFRFLQTGNDKIKNGIELKEDGLHVEEAFLANLNGQFVNNDNKVQVGDHIYLRMVIDGWQVKDGKVFLDASQKVATSSGETLVNDPSIIAPVYTEGATPADAKYVMLNQKIGRLSNPHDYIVITFKVWDKTSNKSVSGLYKLYLQ
jgi:hypothetical protein